MIEQAPQKKSGLSTIVVILCVVVGVVYSNCTEAPRKGERTSKEVVAAEENTLSKVTVTPFNPEIYPVHLMYLKNTKNGLFECRIENPTDQSREYEVTYGLTEFGETEKEVVAVEAGRSAAFRCTPYSSRLLAVETPVNTTLQVKIQELNGKLILEKSYDVKINSCDEIPWKLSENDCSFLIASWITPKNSTIEYLVGKTSEEYGKNVALPDKMSDDEFNEFVKAAFNVVRGEGVSYLNSTISFGEGSTQRVRLPEKSVKYKTANCIDGSVLMASMFENAGLLPYIVIVPGHAFLAVARPGKENAKIFVETTLLGRSKMDSFLTLETTYTAAKRRGYEEYCDAYKKYGNNGQLKLIDVRKCREANVLPM